MVLAIAVIPLVGVELTGLEPEAERGVEIIYAFIWVAFLVDYVVRLILARDKRAYVRREWLSLALVVLTAPLPFFNLGFFDFREVLRGARVLRLFRLFRLGAVVGRGTHRVVRIPTSQNSQLAVAVASFILVTLVSAVLVLAVEEGQNAGENRINTMGNALWWAVSTISTAGYGDVVPATTAGRLLALIPMAAGVLLVAVLVSNLAARIYKRVERRLVSNVETEEDTLKKIERHLAELNDRLARLEATGTRDVEGH